MGRKNKVPSSVGHDRDSKSQAPQSEKGIKDLTDQLLKICSGDLSAGAKLWNEYLEIQKILGIVMELEASKAPRFMRREEHFDVFLQWLKEKGVCIDNICIEHFDKGGWGLKAKNDIAEDQVLLSVPHDIMLTSDIQSSFHLAKVLSNDPIVKQMPQIYLSLHLLEECFNKESFWRPYIDILPLEYDTVLYYTPDELQLLKGSPCLDEALRQHRHIVRQYAYYWQLFHSNGKPRGLHFIEKFTFAAYRWAVSTVMTRQNVVPSPDGSKKLHVLVPLWDMCNHAPGKISTDFNLEKGCLECYAFREFQKGEQVFIHYGDRSNSEFLIHNGFIEPNNKFETVALKLGLSKTDSLAEKKQQVLQKLNIQPHETFFITKDTDPVPSRLIAYVRVFCMDDAELETYLGTSEQRAINDLLSLQCSFAGIVHNRAWAYLRDRFSLLLKGYPTTLQDDVALLADDLEMSTKVRNVISLRIGEKMILSDALKYVTAMCQ